MKVLARLVVPFYWLWHQLQRVLHAIDCALVALAIPFGVFIGDPRQRYPVVLGIYGATYLIALLPLLVLPLVALAVGYIGVLAVGRAWVANEKQRALISKKLIDVDPNSLPDLRWTALLSALQLLILFPLIFQQLQQHFRLFHVPEGTNVRDWFLFTLDTYNKAFLNLLEVYGISVHRITYDSGFGRHLVTLCRLTFDFLLIQGIYRLFSIHETVRDAVKAVTRDPRMPTFVGRRAVQPLINALARPDANVRAKSAEALGLMNDRRAIEPLVAALGDSAESVRFSAAVALAQLGDRRTVEPLISMLGQERDFHERAQAAAGLGALGDVRSVEPLIQALKCVAFEVRWNAAEALGRLGDPRAVGPLVEALLHDEEGAVRQTAAQALGLLRGKQAVDALIEALNDGVYQVRVSAINALAETGDPRAVEALVTALRDSRFLIRSSWNAAEALGKLGDPQGVEPLVEALRGDKDTDVRLIAALAIGKLRDSRAVEALIAALRDEDPRVRHAAAEALGSLGDTRAVEPVMAALDDCDASVRYTAAGVLGALKASLAVERLRKALEDPDADVRANAAEALVNITGGKCKVPPASKPSSV